MFRATKARIHKRIKIFIFNNECDLLDVCHHKHLIQNMMIFQKNWRKHIIDLTSSNIGIKLRNEELKKRSFQRAFYSKLQNKKNKKEKNQEYCKNALESYLSFNPIS